MATTVRIPVHWTNPRLSSLAGNAYWTIGVLTAWDAGRWELRQDVDAKIYGLASLPPNLAGTPAASIVLAVAANATSGVTRLSLGTKAVADTESLNPASFTAETAQDITVPATARLRKDVSFTLAETVAASDLLIVELFHEGAHANDTLAVNTELYAGWLQCDVT